jgi:hypothetical protein
MVDVEKWNIETLIDACSSKPNGKKKLVIPKFQRRREWTELQEDDLIETMRLNKISIGALQLYQLDTKEKTESYLLVDGLHRASTLKKYYDNPFAFKRTQSLIDEIIEELSEKYKKSFDGDEMKNICAKWFCKKSLGCYNEFVVDKIFNEKYEDLKSIVKKSIDNKDRDSISKLILNKTRELCKDVDISKTHIPIIINSGDIETLPILFKRLNQNGTPLKSCDVLAATWYYSKKIEIKNKKIIDCIKTHYENIKNENNKMDIYAGDSDGKTFNLYEYITGLSAYLMNEYEDTFLGNVKDKEFMFKLLACCIFGDTSKKSIDNLKDKMVEMNMSILEETLGWAIQFVAKTIDPIGILETVKPKILIRDIPAFIVMITSAYRKKTKIEKNEEFYKVLFRANFMNYKLSKTNLNAKGIKMAVEENVFTSLVNKKEFTERLNIFMSENNRQRGKADKPTDLPLLILKIIIEEYDILGETVDIGLIVNKKTITSYCKDNGCDLPINGIGNLCIYSSGEKKKKPSEALTKYLSSFDLDNNDIYEKYLSMDGCIDFDDIIDDQEITDKHYIKFLKHRTDCIKNRLLDVFEKCFKKSDDEEESDNDSKSDNGSTSESESDDENKSDNDSDSGSGTDSDSDSDEKPKKKIIVKKVGGRTVMTKK